MINSPILEKNYCFTSDELLFFTNENTRILKVNVLLTYNVFVLTKEFGGVLTPQLIKSNTWKKQNQHFRILTTDKTVGMPLIFDKIDFISPVCPLSLLDIELRYKHCKVGWAFRKHILKNTHTKTPTHEKKLSIPKRRISLMLIQ